MDSARPGWWTPWVGQSDKVIPRPETGSILFDCRWQEAPPTSGPHMLSLLLWREELFRLDLIGVDERGVGFGNLSCRVEGHSPFFISGTGTGAKKRLSPKDFTQVTAWNYDGNWLECRGPCRASSESLSHAAVYEARPQARAVIHVHHAALWHALYMRIPTTHPQAEAGRPEMARAIGHLLEQGCDGGVFVMGGHQDGLMAFGADLEEAGQRLVHCFYEVTG
jgi:L-ribulose-5-phosphate 4-epimerase